MKIRGINFSNVFVSAGVLNFFGDGYWYHAIFKLIPGFKKLHEETFVSKTTVWDPRAGNLPLKNNLQPEELFPTCIKLYFFACAVLNAVNLSGPGAKTLFGFNIWQNLLKPLFISFMAVGQTKEEKIEEARQFIALFKEELPKFKAPVGIQVNVSCPNTGHKTDELASGALEILELFSELGVPIDLKINTLFPIALLKEIERRRLCDVLTISNTIPYGSYPELINWRRFNAWYRLFGRARSPLAKYGGGGLSSKKAFPIVTARIKELRAAGLTLPIKGSGGIINPRHVELMRAAGADAGIEIALVTMVRPWQVGRVIKRANKIFSENN